MKHLIRILFLACLAPAFFSCDNVAENTNMVLTDTSGTDSIPDPLYGYSSKFKLLIETDTALFRGKNLGASTASITEPSLQKIEEDASSITYTVPLEATEQADIIYHFDKLQLNSIEVYAYPKNDSSLQALKTELINFYSKKFDAVASKKDGKIVLLSPKDNIGVEWSEIDNKVIKDLRMYIFGLSSL